MNRYGDILLRLGVAKRRVAKGLIKHGQPPTPDMSNWAALIDDIKFGNHANKGEYLDAGITITYNNEYRGENQLSLIYADSDISVEKDRNKNSQIRRSNGEILYKCMYPEELSNIKRNGNKLYGNKKKQGDEKMFSFDIQTKQMIERDMDPVILNAKKCNWNNGFAIVRFDEEYIIKSFHGDLSFGYTYSVSQFCNGQVVSVFTCEDFIVATYSDGQEFTNVIISDGNAVIIDNLPMPAGPPTAVNGAKHRTGFVVIREAGISVYTIDGKMIAWKFIQLDIPHIVVIRNKIYVRSANGPLMIFNKACRMLSIITARRWVGQWNIFSSTNFFAIIGEDIFIKQPHISNAGNLDFYDFEIWRVENSTSEVN